MPEIFNPEHIEIESMKIIQSIIDKDYPNFSCQDENLSVIKRVIHATADFDFLENLFFSENVVNIARNALKNHTPVITDTLMLAAGITKKFDTKIICNISDEKIKSEAKQRNLTRSIINIEHAAKNFPNAVYAIGNAPTALIKLCELIREGLVNPAVVIGVPVGFVNVIESKNLLESLKEIPRIIARGRKGGTTVACAILNAVLYEM